MSNFATVDAEVYIGAWTNWSRGKVLGSTLTLSSVNGDFLVAFLALFVSFSGTSFFRITCFIIHHFYSTPTAQDDLYHQRQAVLRNSASGTHALFSITGLMMAHSGTGIRGKRFIRRLAPFFLHSVTIITIFAVAGIFSSRIAGLTGDHVLVVSSTSQPPESNMSAAEISALVQPLRANMWNDRLRYAQDCYTDTARPGCNKYIRQNLARQVDRNAACPVSRELCQSDQGNIRIDTGWLDSHHDLGINTPEKDRSRVRHTFHCAPLTTEGYSRKMNMTAANITLPYTRYYYGQIIPPEELGWPPINQTHTAPIENKDMRAPLRPMSSIPGRYYIIPFSAASTQIKETQQFWDPLPGLRRNDSETVVMFLSPQGIEYRGAVDDPWFAAHQPSLTAISSNDDEGKLQLFSADEAAAPLVCLTSYQICLAPFSDASKCSKPRGPQDRSHMNGTVRPLEFSSDISPSQRTMARLIDSSASYGSSVYEPLWYLGGNILKASSSHSNGLQQNLSPTHWQDEVVRMISVILAGFQANVVEAAVGPIDPRLRGAVFPIPQDGQGEYYARNTKIRSAAHSNFSVLGLCIILIVGSLILLCEAILECVYVRLIWRGRDFHVYQRIEWCSNGTLQLQRLAQENAGYGPWEKCDEEIPLVGEDVQLGTMDLSDPKHPRLKQRLHEFSQETRLTPSDSKRDKSSVKTISLQQKD